MWLYHRSNKTNVSGLLSLIKLSCLVAVLAVLGACSGDRLGTSTSPQALPQECVDDPSLPQCQVPAASIYLTLSAQEIKSDGSDATTVTATVLDEYNAVIEGVQVDFSATAGKLSKRFVFTDELGESSSDFSASRADPTNQVVIVTATVAGVGSASIPVRIVGTTLEIVVNNTSLLIDAGATQVKEDITIIAKDAGGQLVYGVPIDFSISGLSGVSLSAAQLTTDTFGEVTVTLTGSTSGTVTFVAMGLGTQVTQAFTVANVVTDNPFRITSPTTNPYALTSDGSTVAIQVAAAGVTTVRFSTTIGVWTDGSSPNTAVTEVAVAGGVATATLQARAGVGDQGFATVVVADASNSGTYDSLTVAMSPPTSSAAQLYLQTDLKTLALSTDTTKYAAEITATVKTDNVSGNYPIYNVPVSFTIANATGGGEYLTVSYATTDLNGRVTTKLVSGKTSTGQTGVTVTATAVSNPLINDVLSIEIGGTAGSVSIGTPRVITVTDSNLSINVYNMSVQVADGTGAAVAGATVTLEAWPESYIPGVWYDADGDPDVIDLQPYWSSAPLPNEDLDENLILDNPSKISGISEDVNEDKELTPKNSDAGTVPVSVVTGSDGTSAFDYTYLKDYAEWVRVRVRATTKVHGTEVTSTRYFIPAILESERKARLVSDSPYVLYLHGTPGNAAYSLDTPQASFGTAVPYEPPYPGVPFSWTPSGGGSMAGVGPPGESYILDPSWLPGEEHEVLFTVTGLDPVGWAVSASFPVRILVR